MVAIDCGANIGVHTIEWATAMTGWGSVVAVEAQERIYYALAGNIAINNCFNAIAMHAAVSSEPGIMNIPMPDYFLPSSFGSLELKPRADTEFIGQPIDYSPDKTVAIQKISIDALSLPRVDFIKLDIEGMELEALEGAKDTIARSRPIFLVESIKAGREACAPSSSEHGYKVADAGINLLAIHKSDPVANELQVPDLPAQSSAAELVHRRAGLDRHRLIAFARQRRQDVLGVRGVARLDRDVELGALGRHVEQQPVVIEPPGCWRRARRAASRSGRARRDGRGWSGGRRRCGCRARARAP